MKRTLTTLCLSIPLFTACGDAQLVDDDPEANLPGDVDRAPAMSEGGKGDEWDYTNDPARLANRLNYRLADLPRQGRLDRPVWASRFPGVVGTAPVAWADTYWPSAELSTNVRWVNATTRSPLEKYDAAFNNAAGCAMQPDTHCGPTAKAKWDTYFGCAGPAAKWHMKNFQVINQMFDGINNDAKGGVDDCSSSDDEGPQGWWGLCHAWTPASLLEPEPQHAVTVGGITFEVGDIKALIETVYDRTDAVMLGGRCNAETIAHDGMISANEECQDVNPGALHVVLGNFLGINDMAVIEDKTGPIQVWNQPIVGYEITKQELVTATRANQCVGASGSRWTFDTKAKKLYEVELTIEYLVEGPASTEPLGMDGYTNTDNVHYILEVGSTGKIIGGKYCTDSVEDHPDFLWAPIAVSTSSYGRNPSVSLAKVRELIAASVGPSGTPAPGGNEKTYENTTGVAIPDNSPTGVSLAITVPDAFAFLQLHVTVDIEHSWRGDLKVELLKNGTSVATLHDNSGGSADNLTQTYTLAPEAIGGNAAQATWTLKAVDGAAQDTGRIKSFKLSFSL